jgi:hypothetical protein
MTPANHKGPKGKGNPVQGFIADQSESEFVHSALKRQSFAVPPTAALLAKKEASNGAEPSTCTLREAVTSKGNCALQGAGTLQRGCRCYCSLVSTFVKGVFPFLFLLGR